MNKSRQEQAFDKWKDDLTRLILSDKKIGGESRRYIQAGLKDFFSYPGLVDNMIQAFSNFMWQMDETIERKVYDELEALIDFIPKIADPEDLNTLAIQAALTQIVAVGGQPIEEVDNKEIEELVSDGEVDDTKPAGL